MRFFALFTAIACLFSTVGIFSRPDTATVSSYPSAQITVVIDAGHGGEDGGACTYGGLPEKELNLLIATDLNTMLSAAGIRTVMTRTEDVLLYDRNSDYKGHKKSMDLAARLKIARETENAILISIHMNAFPETRYGGLQVYYSKNSPDSLLLAGAVQDNNRLLLAPDNERRIKAAGSNIYLLDRYDGTGILIECGFLSNPDDRARLNDAEYRKKLASVIFYSIAQHLSESEK
jgi:N-acetylmuramoyl-L-alanine amidase